MENPGDSFSAGKALKHRTLGERFTHNQLRSWWRPWTPLSVYLLRTFSLPEALEKSLKVNHTWNHQRPQRNPWVPLCHLTKHWAPWDHRESPELIHSKVWGSLSAANAVGNALSPTMTMDISLSYNDSQGKAVFSYCNTMEGTCFLRTVWKKIKQFVMFINPLI